MRRIAGGLALLLLLAGGAGAQRADFEAQRSAAHDALVRQLEDYASWCESKNLFQERKKTLELVLELDPSNAEAPKKLGYVRDKQGNWKPPEKPRAVKDFDAKALAEAPARLKAASAGYVAAMVALLDTGQLSPEQRELAAREALRFDPDNLHVHELLGEQKNEKGWVLPETIAAKARREALRGFVQHALEDVPAAAAAPLVEREQAIPLPLRAVSAPGLRVVGTVEEDELRLCAQAVLGLASLLDSVFAAKYRLPADTTVFLLADPRQEAALIEHHPAVAPERRAFYAKLEGGGIQGTDDFAFWTGDTQRRIDGIVRLVLGFYMTGAFEITVEQGWVYEGFGLYLTRALVRTRMTWLAQPSRVLAPEQDLALRQRLMDPKTNWVDEAHQMLLEKRQPPLDELFKKGASQLTTEDVVYAYALATYFMEAHPEILPQLFARLGAGFPSGTAVQEALNLDLSTFERRLERWLAERN